MNEAAVSVIREYIEKCLFEPNFNWPKYEFDLRSYSRWAANEILERVIEETLRPPPNISGYETKSPINIIKEFIEEMDDFYEVSDSKRIQYICSIAREAAKDILYLFL